MTAGDSKPGYPAGAPRSDAAAATDTFDDESSAIAAGSRPRPREFGVSRV